MTHILAIDQGTTSTRAIIFDADMRPVASAQKEFEQHFPASGWVEHVADDLWTTVLSTCRDALADANLGADDIAAIGITNAKRLLCGMRRPVRRCTMRLSGRTGAPRRFVPNCAPQATNR